ncbi:polyphosphate kinase 2 [Thalassobium sp. R2A62]|jgi:polyphosphate kinase 2|uniref:polyphosphate kinase 2 n=1 Tax=Thalassobium sp. R2A62 TaxID=633131 RepID=UPI0001B1D279|nr:polyphosphate kinase 2 [Thalassobium sp. R2A62]EET47268.1 polyphosphate kinase 2 [Thalassobium sp. R2A62]MDG1339447.1 polyphosphate kinase 2 [Paracoccaceae bacterium]
MDLPFDGAISAFYDNEAPEWVRDQIKSAKKNRILNPDYPYDSRWYKGEYEDTLAALQIELVRLQAWVKESGARIAIVFEGRDAAGKGGTIKRFRENLSARSARVVALSKPTDRERGEWYFQRYIKELPAEGEITFFDRSWYNRGVVEHVFGFCEPQERELFFKQVNPFEQMLVEDGVQLFKIWLNVGRAEQLRRFRDREKDPLKQWKLSGIDVKGLSRWDPYSQAIGETLARSHTDAAPWTVVRSDDKRRARVGAIQAVLSQIDYARKGKIVSAPDPKVVGGPDLWADASGA